MRKFFIIHVWMHHWIRKLQTIIYQIHIQFETNFWYGILACLQRSGMFFIRHLTYFRMWLVGSDTNYSTCDWLFYTEIRVASMFFIRDPMQIHPHSYAYGMYLVCAVLSHTKKYMYCILLSITFFSNTSREYFLFDRVMFN